MAGHAPEDADQTPTVAAAIDLLHAGRPQAAEQALLARLAAGASDTDTLRLLGQVLRRLGRPADALARYDAALAAAPDDPLTLLSRANLLNDLHRWPEAVAAADQALRHDPTLAAAANARGNALAGLGRGQFARASFRHAAELAPTYADPLVNLGNTELSLGDAAAALAAYDRAAAVAPNLAPAWSGRGHALSALRRWPEAVTAYDRAWALDPNLLFLAGQRLHARMKVCDWTTLPRDLAAVRSALAAGRPPSVPFPLLAFPLTASEQGAATRLYAAATFGEGARNLPAAPREGARIRLAYVSGDFHEHATAYLIAELIALHDRAQFEVIGLSIGAPRSDPMRQRLEAAFDQFHDLSQLDDAQAAQFARGLSLDIAVDLKGYTTDSRPALFAARLAPVQVSYLGYPGTLGAGFIDYVIGDPIVTPPALRGDYAEKVACASACYQANDRSRPRPARTTRREDHGLPARGLVFGCFNNNYKILPDVFAGWMRLLQAVEGSVLWLFQDNPTAAANLRAAAGTAGVDPARLVFAGLRPLEAHLERHWHMDLFLDTGPYNAHTTASDALWMDVPLVTWLGDTFAGRVAASLLNAVGLPELVAASRGEAEALSLALAREPARLAGLRSRLAAGRGMAPLFDTPRLARDLEALYDAMQQRRLAGLPPDHLGPF